MVIAVAWTVLAIVRSRTSGVGRAISTSVAEAGLAAAILAIWVMTLAPLGTPLPAGFEPPAPTNLVPVIPLVRRLLSAEAGSYLLDYVGNVALFVPLGIGLAWRFRLPVARVAVVAAVASGAIETWQAVVVPQQRNGDVNDVLLNTTGALVGAWLVAIVAGILVRQRSGPSGAGQEARARKAVDERDASG
jgi:glycopeptide antibiotics resistance protein